MVSPEQSTPPEESKRQPMVLFRKGKSVLELRFWYGPSGARPVIASRSTALPSPSMLEQALAVAAQAGIDTLYTEALHPAMAALFLTAGFTVTEELVVLSRRLGLVSRLPAAKRPKVPIEIAFVDSSADPSCYEELAVLDRRAFDGFWSLDSRGLWEAVRSTHTASVLVARCVAQRGETSSPTDKSAAFSQKDLADGTISLFDTSFAGNVVAYAIVGYYKRTAYLQRLAVDPALEGNGIGTSIAVAALARAKRRLAAIMWVNTPVRNERALSLYESLGFRRHPTPLLVLKRQFTTSSISREPRSAPKPATMPGVNDDDDS
ncbi:MAG: hypothetical protein C4318_01085 [Acidimicrobiia bacterium]